MPPSPTLHLGTVTIAAVVAAAAPPAAAPRPAPALAVSEWVDGWDPGSLASMRGKVVLIHFFQVWCPGCRTFSTPLFQEWHERYGDRDDVVFLGIHTVFEGHSYQTPGRLYRYLEVNDVEYPVGLDAYASPEDDIPITMKRYRTGGTPSIAIIDRAGDIRFQHLGSFRTGPVDELIQRLLGEPPPAADETTGPRSRRDHE